MSGSDGVPDYAALSPPEHKPPHEYEWPERRAELYRLIEQRGHPHNLERSQRELADRYGVSQKQISKDIQKLREYERDKGGGLFATSNTSWLAEKSVNEIIEAATDMTEKAESTGDPKLRKEAAQLWQEALDTQMEYNDFLFKLGQLDEAPMQHEVNVDPGELYMEMLEQAHEDGSE